MRKRSTPTRRGFSTFVSRALRSLRRGGPTAIPAEGEWSVYRRYLSALGRICG